MVLLAVFSVLCYAYLVYLILLCHCGNSRRRHRRHTTVAGHATGITRSAFMRDSVQAVAVCRCDQTLTNNFTLGFTARSHHRSNCPSSSEHDLITVSNWPVCSNIHGGVYSKWFLGLDASRFISAVVNIHGGVYSKWFLDLDASRFVSLFLNQGSYVQSTIV